MIARLTGVAIDRGFDGCCVLDVQGVGYEVFVPLRTLSRMAGPPELVTLHVHTHVREETFKLYGFADPSDRAAFRVMLGVSGVGPKLAMAILNELSAAEVGAAVAAGDKKRFAAIAGIGRKMADRLVLELKGKLDGLSLAPGASALPPAPAAQGRAGEVAAALIALGFSRPQADAAAAKVVPDANDARPIETLIRQALATLA